MSTLLKRETAIMPKSAQLHLDELRRALLHLHKVLLEIERAAYEKIHGRVSAGELLRLVIQDKQFAWLRPVSEIIVQIDELLDGEEPLEEDAVRRLSRQTQDLLLPAETGGAFARNYHLALQSTPDAVLAHRAVRLILSAKTAP
jgi:PAS domain-containing protein